jgi:hypothetical protein
LPVAAAAVVQIEVETVLVVLVVVQMAKTEILQTVLGTDMAEHKTLVVQVETLVLVLL